MNPCVRRQLGLPLLKVPCPLPVTLSPLSKYAVAHQLQVPFFCPALVAVIVPCTTPNPVALPSKFTCTSTLPAGPGVNVNVVALSENSPTCCPDAIMMSLLR